jgi:hypothetical protein
MSLLLGWSFWRNGSLFYQQAYFEAFEPERPQSILGERKEYVLQIAYDVEYD